MGHLCTICAFGPARLPYMGGRALNAQFVALHVRLPPSAVARRTPCRGGALSVYRASHYMCASSWHYRCGSPGRGTICAGRRAARPSAVPRVALHVRRFVAL